MYIYGILQMSNSVSSCFLFWWHKVQCSRNVSINDGSRHEDNP